MVELTFRPYLAADEAACLRIFDANTPAYFSPDERADYLRFLASTPTDYEVCELQGAVAGAFGVFCEDANRVRLHWILLDRSAQGAGLGSKLMVRAISIARSGGAICIDIAASHRSAGFFERFGAIPIAVTDHGWGPDMHRVDMELAL